MINLQKLRHLSCICAYCGKVMPMNERTNDHIIPRSAGGQTEANNIVICCQECNGLKGSTLINDFLEKYPEKAECFYNYLNMIDYQIGNNEYSDAVSEVLSESLKMSYKRKKRREKKLRKKQKKATNKISIKQEDIQNIKYHFELSGQDFYINELQAKILDYYLNNPDFSDYKTLAKNLGISKTQFIREICCINNLTGVFKIKRASENGIVLNDFMCNNIQNQIIKTDNNQICKSFLPNIDGKSEILILGSMPGVKSLEEQQYYAHPQNRFWRLMGLFCDVENLQDFDYQEKLQILLKNKIALWDVIQSCNRDGSLDSNIQNEVPNNIPDLLKLFPKIRVIGLNGNKSYTAFKKHFPDLLEKYSCYKLPSTSPANARYKLDDLYNEWNKAINLLKTSD